MENKLRKNWEILKKDGDEIKAIRRSDNLIIAIGDTCIHYHTMICKILSFKIGGDKQIIHNYETLEFNGNPYPDFLRELEMGKHFSCISNIISIKERTNESKQIYDNWWMHENIRRKGLPKYEVLSDFPNSKYRTGQVVKAYSEDDWKENKHLQKEYDKFPNIFKRIN